MINLLCEIRLAHIHSVVDVWLDAGMRFVKKISCQSVNPARNNFERQESCNILAFLLVIN